MRELVKAFEQSREKAGEAAWLQELGRYGWHSLQEMRNAIDNRTPHAKEKAVECYRHLKAIGCEEVA